MADSEHTASDQKNAEEYEKTLHQQSSGARMGSGMATDRNVGSVGGGTVPSSDQGLGSGTPERGINTSNSTVSGGGTVPGGNIGAGSTTDRGSMNSTDITTNTGNTVFNDARNKAGEEAHADTGSSRQEGGKQSKHKGSSPLSQEEARRINQDARGMSETTKPPDIGHER